jgi:uronate dehydrogenase
MKVLFVGATGLIGRQVIPDLTNNYSLQLLAHTEGEVAGLPVHAVDITDFEQVMAYMEGVDAVVNSAIRTGNLPDGTPIDRLNRDHMMYYAEGSIEVNVRGAYHLYEAAARCGVKKFVMVSSLTAVLGLPTYKHIPANAESRPVDFYACTKIFGEDLGYLYAHRDGMQVSCLRLGQPYPSFSGLDDDWVDSARARGAMVTVQDVGQAISCALDTEIQYGVYPVVSNSDEPWIDISASEAIGYKPRYKFTEQGLFNELGELIEARNVDSKLVQV